MIRNALINPLGYFKKYSTEPTIPSPTSPVSPGPVSPSPVSPSSSVSDSNPSIPSPYTLILTTYAGSIADTMFSVPLTIDTPLVLRISTSGGIDPSELSISVHTRYNTNTAFLPDNYSDLLIHTYHLDASTQTPESELITAALENKMFHWCINDNAVLLSYPYEAHAQYLRHSEPELYATMSAFHPSTDIVMTYRDTSLTRVVHI